MSLKLFTENEFFKKLTKLLEERPSLFPILLIPYCFLLSAIMYFWNENDYDLRHSARIIFFLGPMACGVLTVVCEFLDRILKTLQEIRDELRQHTPKE